MSVERARIDLERWERAANQFRSNAAEAEEQAAKIRIYIEMASVYDVPEGARPAETPGNVHVSPTNGAAPSRNKGGRPRGAGGGIVERAQKGSETFLRVEHRPMLTRELLSKLEAQGTPIGGKSPTSNLSGMLSRSPLFKSGKDGWSLTEWLESQATTSEQEPTTGNKQHASVTGFD